MGHKVQGRLIFALSLLLCAVPAFSQKKEPADSLVRLMQAESLQLLEENGISYRKAIASTFLHNGTYLISDTALWNVNTKRIHAYGNVRVIQDETILTSDELDYDIDADLAMFRGSLVQMQDRDKNTLRTHFLDYNTKDSVAVFQNGGSFKASDGQVIESMEGRYDSGRRLIRFDNNVNMFTDSVFIKTSKLEYDTARNFATFPVYVDFWKEGNMMSANEGWYNRKSETFFFQKSVHALTKEQETWSDSLYYYRGVGDALLLGRAQMQDTTRNVTAVADYMFYQDSLSQFTLSRRAAVAMKTEQGEKIDTIYFGADTIRYKTVKMCDIHPDEIKDAKSRLDDIFVDPVAEYRAKAAKAAAEAAEEAARNNPNAGPRPPLGQKGRPLTDQEQPQRDQQDQDDQEQAPEEAAAPETQVDTTIVPEPDTTKVGFLYARHNVKAFRQDIQLKCDSLRYTDLDSIARFYLDPVVWNEGRRQYSSDSLFILVHNGGMDRASLMSNAFIITQEDSVYFDQIKGAEVMAYFDTTSALRRFDALGGATAMFYLQENDAIATVNKVETKMLSAAFVNGDIDRVFYFESPKNDAYPVVQLPPEDHRMKGYNWQPENKPTSPRSITTLSVRQSERRSYEAHPHATFKQTDRYFPGYMKSVYRGLAVADSLKRLPKPAKQDGMSAADTVATLGIVTPVLDSTALRDSLSSSDSLALRDSLSAAVDSLAAGMDSLALADSLAAADSLQRPMTEREKLAAERAAKRAAARAERERKEAERIAKRDARWAELDARDAARAAAKAEKAKARKRKRTLRLLKAQMKQDAADQQVIDRYKERFEKKKRKTIDNGETD